MERASPAAQTRMMPMPMPRRLVVFSGGTRGGLVGVAVGARVAVGRVGRGVKVGRGVRVGGGRVLVMVGVTVGV